MLKVRYEIGRLKEHKDYIEEKYDIDVLNKVSVIIYTYKNNLSENEEREYKEDLRYLFGLSQDLESRVNQYDKDKVSEEYRIALGLNLDEIG